MLKSNSTAFGVSELILNKDDSCFYMECDAGDIITDAFLSFYRKSENYTKPAVAFLQAGGIRGGLVKGCECSKFISIDETSKILTKITNNI